MTDSWNERWNTYLAPLGRIPVVEPVHLGWLHQAIRIWSGRYSTVYGQCAHAIATTRRVAGYHRRASWRNIDPGWLSNAVGRSRTRHLVLGDRLRRAFASRRYAQHDQFLQKPGDGWRLPVRSVLWTWRYQRRPGHRHRKGVARKVVAVGAAEAIPAGPNGPVAATPPSCDHCHSLAWVGKSSRWWWLLSPAPRLAAALFISRPNCPRHGSAANRSGGK
jgi:hypothetical protein